MKPLSVLLSLIFLWFGSAKLLALPFETEAFARWGYPLWFMYVTGALEVLGAIGVLLPRWSALAAACLALLMVGAVSTHALHAEWQMLAVASGILALAAWHGWNGRREIRGLRSSNPH